MSLKGFKKRILVTEGDLFHLYKEVQQIRKAELKEQYNTKFRALLKDAEFVSFSINPKSEGNGSTDK